MENIKRNTFWAPPRFERGASRTLSQNYTPWPHDNTFTDKMWLPHISFLFLFCFQYCEWCEIQTEKMKNLSWCGWTCSESLNHIDLCSWILSLCHHALNSWNRYTFLIVLIFWPFNTQIMKWKSILWIATQSSELKLFFEL